MTLLTLADLPGRLGRDERLLGIDPGARRIGLALSDATRFLSSPYGTLARGKLAANAAEVARIAAKEGAVALVVGLPLGLDGGFGPAAQAARDWARALSDAAGLPAVMWDERLSSAAVERQMLAADLSRARRAASVDRHAAAWILQGALDALRVLEQRLREEADQAPDGASTVTGAMARTARGAGSSAP